MKLSVMQENLARGLQVVSRAVSSRSTLPVLANVLLRTEDAGLKLTATNLEIGITYWVPGKIETDGNLTVPARLLTDVVNSLPPGERVDLESDGAATVTFRIGSSSTGLHLGMASLMAMRAAILNDISELSTAWYWPSNSVASRSTTGCPSGPSLRYSRNPSSTTSSVQRRGVPARRRKPPGR